MLLSQMASMPTHTPLLAMQQAAASNDPDVGLAATTAFLEFWRPRVRRLVAVLYRGLRRPRLSLDEYAELVLVSVAAQLDGCTARSDSALHAWVSARTTQAVLELHFDLRTLARGRHDVLGGGDTGRAA